MEQNPLLEIGLPVSLAIIMAGMGLTLTLRDFRNVLVYPRAMLVGSLAQMVILPLLAFVLASVLRLPPLLAVGLVVIAACPGGAMSNVLTFLARGNVALSIIVTVIASFVTILTLPLFTNLALNLLTVQDMAAPMTLPFWESASKLFIVVLLPVIVGMMVRARRPGLAVRGERLVSLFGVLVLAFLVLMIVWETRSEVTTLVGSAGPASLALNITGIALGFATALVPGICHRDAMTLAIELGIKNGTIGLMMTLTLIGSYPMAMPSAVYGVMMFALGAVLVAWGRRQRFDSAGNLIPRSQRRPDSA